MAKVRLSEVANEVRESWCKATDGVPVVGLEHLDPEDIWLRTWQTDGEENTFRKAFRKGQLLFGRRRAYQKKLSIAPCDGICSGDITVIAANEKKVLPELLPFYLRSDRFFDYAMKGSGGSLSPRVKWSHLAGYEFDLPPLKRQRELAKLLWAANDLREKYKKLITASDEMLKAKFREMFGECGGQSNDGGVKIGDAFLLKAGKAVKANDIANSKDKVHMYPCYGGNGIRGYVSECSHEGVYCLIGRQGEYSGNVQIASGRFYATEHAVVVTPMKEIEPVWLCQQLRAMNLLQYSRGVAQPGLAVGAINKLMIKLPPLSLQRQFVEIAAQEEKVKANLKNSIADVDNIITGLING